MYRITAVHLSDAFYGDYSGNTLNLVIKEITHIYDNEQSVPKGYTACDVELEDGNNRTYFAIKYEKIKDEDDLFDF